MPHQAALFLPPGEISGLALGLEPQDRLPGQLFRTRIGALGRLLVMVQRFLGMPLPFKHGCEVEMPDSVVGLELERLAVGLDGLIDPTETRQRHPA